MRVSLSRIKRSCASTIVAALAMTVVMLVVAFAFLRLGPSGADAVRPSASLGSSSSGCSEFEEHFAKAGTARILSGGRSPEPDANAFPIPNVFHFIYYGSFSRPSYLCSIESAARQNPTYTILIHALNFEEFENLTSAWWHRLEPSISKNIKLTRLTWEDAFQDTPLLNWFQSNVYASGKYPEQELGDAARLALIWHHGGIYADLDIISVSPISRIGRCIAQDDAVMLNNALLSFPQHDPFILLLMHVFVRDFQGHSWAFNGPWLVTKVYNSLCRLSFDTNEKTDIVTDLHPDIVKQADASCASLVAAIPSRFHPINWRDREVLYKPWNASCEVLHDITRTSIAVHVWRRLPVGLKTPNDSLFVKILENACPNVLLSFTPAEIGIISGTTIQKTVGAFHYLGCFKTSPERQILRTELTSEIDGKMTLEKCARLASEYSFLLFGVERSKKCFAGFEFSSYTTETDGCSMHCLGNEQEYCGGSEAMSVYKHNKRFE